MRFTSARKDRRRLEVGPTRVVHWLADQESHSGNLIAHWGFNFLLPLP